jgi:hypothetical protein
VGAEFCTAVRTCPEIDHSPLKLVAAL